MAIASLHADYGHHAPYAGRRGLSAQTLSLAIVWITMALSSIVMIEPAPFDALMMGLIILLPMVGLTAMSNRLFLLFIAWMAIAAFGLIAATQSTLLTVAIKHTVVTLFLSMTMLVVAAFVAYRPERHARLLMSGYLWAAVLASIAAIAGYFDLVPGLADMFTKFGRAKGTFKDPNVFGAFLIPAFIYCVHVMLCADERGKTVKTVAAAVLCVGLLVSFSRGAWFNAAISLAVYGYLIFIAAPTNRFRIKLLVISFFGLCALTLGIGILIQIDNVSSLLSERATIAQSYDTGPGGRFGGQLKALNLIASNPFGIGALEFSRIFHSEDVHNVYLSMFLNSGWLGGFLFGTLVFATILAGLACALRKTALQGLSIVLVASFISLALEGVVIDLDHWRHFFILMGLIWGLSLSTPRSWNCQPQCPDGYGRSGRI